MSTSNPHPTLRPEWITAAAEAIEEAAIPRIGRDLGTVHRDEIVAAGLSAVLPLIRADAVAGYEQYSTALADELGDVRTELEFARAERSARDARVRAEVAEEIARAIEAARPSERNFWDTADVARVYALNHAAKVARRYAAAPTEPSVGASVVSAEGSGHPQPATARHALSRNGRVSVLCVDGADGCEGNAETCACSCHNPTEGES